MKLGNFPTRFYLHSDGNSNDRVGAGASPHTCCDLQSAFAGLARSLNDIGTIVQPALMSSYSNVPSSCLHSKLNSLRISTIILVRAPAAATVRDLENWRELNTYQTPLPRIDTMKLLKKIAF